MHIEKYTRNGIEYIRLAESYTINENGISKQKKRPIYHIGPLRKFDDGQPDFFSKTKKIF